MSLTIDGLAPIFPDLHGLAFLGQGGQRVVLSATHATEGDVVLKILPPFADEERMNREELAVTTVNSPRVPRILARGEIDTPVGRVFWIREQRIPGKNVRTVLRDGPLSTADVFRLGVHVLEALEAGEAVGIVHRDVKPDNIMRDESGAFWLLDYGIARHRDLPTWTSTGASPLGTPGYAPPEQWCPAHTAVDSRTDLFALGVTLCECVTAKHPFRDNGTPESEVQRRIAMSQLPSFVVPGDRANEFHDFIVTLAMSRRDHRPDSVAEARNWLLDVGKKLGLPA